MDFTEIINIAVVLLSGVGGYVVYIMKRKAAQIDALVSRIVDIEKEQAVLVNEIDHLHERQH